MFQSLLNLLQKRNEKEPKDLSKEDKFKILIRNKLPTSGPKNKDGRMFKAVNITGAGEQAKYIHYCADQDKCFCLACAFFGVSKSQSIQTKWTQTGYNDWKRLNDKKKGLNLHITSETHLQAHVLCSEFVTGLSLNINRALQLGDKVKAAQIEENRKLLGASINVIKLCARQMLPLRGHRETFDPENPDKNRGNFLAIMDTVGIYSETVQKVLDDVKGRAAAGSKKQASMLSRTVQNEIIRIMGDEVLKNIVNEVKKAGQYCIISDETTIHNTQYLTVGVRYVHQGDLKVREEFIAFREMESATADYIFQLLLETLQEADLPLGKNELLNQRFL